MALSAGAAGDEMFVEEEAVTFGESGVAVAGGGEEVVIEREGAAEVGESGAGGGAAEDADVDHAEAAAPHGEGVAGPAPDAAPAPPGVGAAAIPPRNGRRRLELVDLDQLKANRANLKRQLKICSKEVKAQAG